jgi:hypothetical protein
MVKEGDKLAAIAPNVVVKLPLTWDGLRAARAFADKGIRTNVTLCFSAAQAMLAAKAGATFISPFVGRLEDHGADGIGLLEEIRVLYDCTASRPRFWPPACATRTTYPPPLWRRGRSDPAGRRFQGPGQTPVNRQGS